MKVRSLNCSLVLLSAFVVSATAALAQLTPTPETTEGPYYPFNSTQRLNTTSLVGADNDLTLVAGSSTRASGTPLLLSGQLVNLAGAPVAGATIEIWQTDNNGLYYHSVVTLAAGASYTAVLSGVSGATGEALVEIYDLQ